MHLMIRRFGKSKFHWIALFAVCACASPTTAESFRLGDVFVNRFGDRLYQYRPDGALVQSFQPSGPSIEGATVTRDGKLVTTFRSTSVATAGLSVFDAQGNETLLPTPEVSIPADVSVFHNGTFAICDQDARKVHLYSPAGAFLRSIETTIVGVTDAIPFGSAVGRDDTLWVAQYTGRRPSSLGGISRYNMAGELLGHFSPGFVVSDIAIDPVDNTLWTLSPDGWLHHFNTLGVPTGSFLTTLIPSLLSGVAVAADQSIYVTTNRRDVDTVPLLHYDRTGRLLDQFDVPAPVIFISVQTVPEPSTLALVALGCAAIWHRRRRQG